jgi:hypothetical protein
MNLGMAFLIFIMAIVLHEFGHWVYFKTNKKKNVRIWFRDWAFAVGDYDKDYIGLTLPEKRMVLWYGVVIGLAPIIFMASSDANYFWLIGFYILGCKTDILELRRLFRE